MCTFINVHQVLLFICNVFSAFCVLKVTYIKDRMKKIPQIYCPQMNLAQYIADSILPTDVLSLYFVPMIQHHLQSIRLNISGTFLNSRFGRAVLGSKSNMASTGMIFIRIVR